MIDPASVAFDRDGVIADTLTLFLEIARDEFNLNNPGIESPILLLRSGIGVNWKR